jgi:hypothetical protein
MDGVEPFVNVKEPKDGNSGLVKVPLSMTKLPV